MTASAKLAIVTGGCSGLGQASAEYLLANGWHVVIFDVNKDDGAEIAQKMHPSNCRFDYVDVTSSELVEAAVNRLAESEIRLLINIRI